jgi:PAS domain S-box-containing protein
MSKQLRVLLVEDSEDDAALLTRALKKGGIQPVVERVETADAMKKALQNQEWNVVIADYVLPRFSGLDAVNVLKKTGKDLPFIIVSGKIGEDTAVEAMRAGAHDYIMKGNLARLLPAIEREIEEANVRKKRRDAEDELRHSYHDLADTTAQLETVNKQLRGEIEERHKAEIQALEMKEHLQNVIDSASEVIISIDANKRVSTWNKTAEMTTGYKQKDVLNWNLVKLSLFENTQKLLDLIKNLSKETYHSYDDFVIITKNQTKKILRITGTIIKEKEKQGGGVLFIGRDITREMEIHGKLLSGNSYLIPEKSNAVAVDLLVDLATSGYLGYMITRSNPESIKDITEPAHIQLYLLGEDRGKKYTAIPTLQLLIQKVKELCKKKKETVILLERLDYLINKFSFEKVMDTLYQINDLIAQNKCILLVRIDPATIEKTQMALIENELQMLPSQKIEGLTIEDEVYDILRFIYEQNQNNAIVPIKKIMGRFTLAYSTVAKRLQVLEAKGLIFTKKQGKSRTVTISDKGKTFLHKRQTA